MNYDANSGSGLLSRFETTTLVEKCGGFDFYVGHCHDKSGCYYTLYNIVPTNSPTPKWGYENMKTVEWKRGIKFPERYQMQWIKEQQS